MSSGFTGPSSPRYNDHRVLMALAIAGSTATGVTELSYPHAYRISYPEFADHMNTARDPDRRHLRGAELAGRADIAEGLITELVGQHARERPDDRAVVEVGEGGAVREWSFRELEDAAGAVGSAAARAGRRTGRAGRLPAAEPARVRRDLARRAADRRDLRAVDADLPRARARVHAARRRQPRADRATRVPRPRPRGDGPRTARASTGLEYVVVLEETGLRRLAPRSSEIAARRHRTSLPSCSSPRAQPASPRACCRRTPHSIWRRICTSVTSD